MHSAATIRKNGHLKRRHTRHSRRRKHDKHTNNKGTLARYVPPTSTSPSSSKPPTIALLFLTIEDHEQPALWDAFLSDPVYGKRFAVYCHPQQPSKIPQGSFLRANNNSSSAHSHQGILPRKELVPKPQTRWAHLTLAYYALLNRALTDPQAQHSRFVFLSNTCVPCSSPEHAYKELTTHLECSYYTTEDPTKDAGRYDGVDRHPSRSIYPPQRHRNTQPVKCNVVLSRAGVKREHFFKHSGWFALNRADSEHLHACRSAFQALNHVSAGDEHILSILKRPSYAASNSLVQRPVTMAFWDATTRDAADFKRMHTERNSGDAFWNTYHHSWSEAEQNAHDSRWAQLTGVRGVMYHPRSFEAVFPKEALQQCQRAGSLFVRKVCRGCDVRVLHRAIIRRGDGGSSDHAPSSRDLNVNRNM
jgi:hypothetical protein